MTPTQREAAERLADDLQRFDGAERESLRDEAAALLRELLAEPVINQQMTTELAEPVQEPVAYIDPRQLAAGYVTLRCITRPEYRSYADVAEGVHYTPVYLHPPQQRKPLLRGEIIGLWKDRSDGPSNAEIISFARAIERAHGITGEPT